MACALTQGFNVSCRDSIGGVKEVFLIETANISSYTETSGMVSAITTVTGSAFHQYQQFKETSEGKESLKAQNSTGGMWSEQTLTLVLPKMQTSVRNEILVMTQIAAITAIVITYEGTAVMYGAENGLSLDDTEITTGKARSDLNGYTLTLTGFEPAPAPTLDESVIEWLYFNA